MEITIDSGTLLFASEDPLAATGLLVPYGVEASSNLGSFTVDAGVFEMPADVTGMGVNIEHEREQVVGGFTKVWEQPEAGILYAMRFADTPEGRKAAADAKAGKRAKVSVEASGVRIRGGKAIAGRIFGAALVEKPAFAGATLLAAEDTDDEEETDEPADGEITSSYSSSSTSSDGSSYSDKSETTELVEDLGDGKRRVTRTTITVTEVTDPDTEGEPAMTGTLTASEPVAAVPGTLLAGAPAAPAVAAEPEIDLGTIFASMALVKSGGAEGAPDAATLLAALADIKAEAAGGLTGANSGVLQPAWVGRLWQGKRYTRKYIDLVTHLYGGIQLGGRKGFKLNQGTALVTKWSGNKTEIGSGTATTSPFGSTLQRYGYAADVAREWYDLEGGAEVIQAFFEGVIDSYAKVTDLDALEAIFLAASKSAAALDRLIAPDAYPAQYPAALGQLIQGIEAVQDAEDDPTFALVNPVAWKQLIYTPKDLIPEFVTFDFKTGGEGTADGKVVVRKAPAATFAGLTPANPQTIVGAKAAIEFREHGQTPIQIDALEVAKGGVDKAVIGYLETFVVRPESLALVGTKP